jgi:cellulose synthase/poly-beta-1,6-N-acetylglucosamine synthase-like glycosyltransferase
VALIPAYNEEGGIEATLRSLLTQTVRPDRLIVVADNCTDDTAAVVARFASGSPVAVRTLVTVDNAAKKAGALNQALHQQLRVLRDDDLILVMDADSALDSRWIETALVDLRNPTVGAVGGVFYGRPGDGMIGQFQRNEYQRYAREIGRSKARAKVLTGTATMFSARVARLVRLARGNTLPGTSGQVYDTAALTEDNELTLALKTLGYRCVSPRECRVTTELMPTWRDLWWQRMRWQRGALENLRHYGLTRVTAPYVLQQAALAVGIVAMGLFLGTLAVSLLMGFGLAFRPLWSALALLFAVERGVTVRRVGWRGVLLAAPLVLEMVYDVFQMAVYVVSVGDIVFRREASWRHVTPATVRKDG